MVDRRQKPGHTGLVTFSKSTFDTGDIESSYFTSDEGEKEKSIDLLPPVIYKRESTGVVPSEQSSSI